MIPVAKPFLPSKEEYMKYLDGIWLRNWLTNMGPLSSQLELEIKDYLNVKHLLYVTNGTVALQMAIRALEIKGDIITTPFSFVATTSSIVWEGCNPIFVDIDKDSLNIDAKKIENAITENTSAILATHVYGNPCDVEAIDKIAKKHGLKVIYDGAHAFGVDVNGKSIFEYGDVSTCSLHATKLFHSVEGGLVVTKDSELLKKISSIRNFGISGFDTFSDLGINGKNSEFHAAMGLANLRYINQIHIKRKALVNLYDEKLKTLRSRKPIWRIDSNKNFAYYPIVLESEEFLLKLKTELDKQEIFTRRYFYPSLASSLPYLPKLELPITEDIAKRVLCLPLYFDLTFEEVEMISRIILRIQNN